MFDMSWGEVMVIGTVALIVIGPKELPRALRTLGGATAKVRRMAAEFQTQFNDAMREADLDDVKREVEGINRSVSTMGTGFNPVQTIRDEIRSAADMASASPSTGSSAGVGASAETSVPLPPVPPVTEPGLSAVLGAEGASVPQLDHAAQPEKPESARV